MARCLPSLAALGLLAACGGVAQQPPPPIILISLDTLRPDRLGHHGYPRDTSPNLDRFAAEAVVFDRAYAQAPETLYSHASLFSSRYPSELGPLRHSFRFPQDVPTLASVLRTYGYATAAMTAGGFMAEGFGLQAGFDEYYVLRDWGSLQHTVPAALTWLDSRPADQPWFLFVHGYDAHARYLKPTPWGYAWADPQREGPARQAVRAPGGTRRVWGDSYYPGDWAKGAFSFDELYLWGPENLASISEEEAQALTAEDHQHISDVYDGAVAYLDAHFGVLMAGLQERELLDEAVIVVFSDHGEALGEHGLYNHIYLLEDEILAVELMLRLPGGEHGGQRRSELVGLHDVTPTLLELAGATEPASTRGRSLLPGLRGEETRPRQAIFSEGAHRQVSVRSRHTRLSFQGLSAGSPYLADVMEVAPLPGPAFGSTPPERSPDELEDLRSALVHWRRSLPPCPIPETEEWDPALIQHVQRHGYWGHR